MTIVGIQEDRSWSISNHFLQDFLHETWDAILNLSLFCQALPLKVLAIWIHGVPRPIFKSITVEDLH